MPVAAGRRQRPLGPDDPRHPRGRVEHGLTGQEREYLKRQQGFACAICGRPDGPGDAALELDHDHRCHAGQKGCRRCVRGYLCGPCNRSLGRIGDRNVDTLVAYLTRRRPR
jgi:hypothetical protein